MQKRVKVAVASFVAAALVITAVWIGVDRLGRDQAVTGPEPGANAQVTLTAEKADASGIDPAGGFKLTSTRPLTAAALRQTLSVQPAVDLKIDPASGAAKEFRIQPVQALDPNRVYRFALAATGPVGRPFGWSFQTRSPFRVVSSLPRDHSNGVPVTTGIELTFSHENYADPDSFFTITPKVEGRFERHKKTLAFVPKNPLTPGTIYTVTLKQGLGQKGADGKITSDFTFAFETEPAGGGKGEQTWFEMPTEMQEFPTGDAPYFQFLYHKGGKELAPEAQVTVYRYKDAAAFTGALTEADKVPWWSSFGRRSYRESISGLNRVTAFRATPTPFAGIGSYLLFPEKLAPGYYLAEFQVDDQVRQTRFQVTDLSSYLMVTTTQTLVWINDLNAKSPVAGAKDQVAGGGDSATTGADGVAVVPTPAGTQRKDGSAAAIYLYVQGPGGKEAVVAAQSGSGNYGYYGGQDRAKASLYWRYLYLDRSLYKPEDPVNLWGVVRPREPGAAPISQVTAEVTRSDYRDEAEKPIPLASVDLKVDESTFTGTLRLPGVQPGWYELQVRSGEDWLYSQWFEVQTYVKPAYQIDLTQDKRAAFAGDKVTFTASSTFFDGTPVPNLSLGYSLGWGGGASSALTTDANGQASATLTMPDSGNGEWGGPSDTWLNIHSTLPEAGEITTGASVQVFSRDVTVQPKLQVTNGQATVTGQANLVTLEQLNQGTGWNWTGAPAAGRPVKGSLKQIILHERENGEYYDFIQKRVVKQYYYEREFKEAGTFQALTDASGKFVQTLLVDPDASYELDLQVEDTHGRAVIRKLFFYGKDFKEYENYPWHYYYLNTPDNKDAWPSGQPVTLTFQEGERKVEDRLRGFLFVSMRLGLQSWQVQDTGAFQYSLKAGDPPNTNIRGIYFDGRLYRETWDRTLRLDPKEREMQVTVTADKAAYRPGDTVTVTVKAKDSKGRPASAARVNLNLVDEALFALRDQRINTLNAIYGDYVGTGLLRTRASHAVPSPGGGAEKGGEGGGVRKDFKDAVFFHTVVTDAQGKATASFKVPDNLTMWRLTWQSLSPATMEAASGTIGIPVKLPFFVEMNPGESFLTGDKPALLLRSYGTALKEGQGVRYQVELQGPVGWKVTQEGQAFTPTYAPMPELTAGTYTLTVRATTGGTLEDAVEKRFTVQDSYLRQTKVDHYLLAEGLQVKAPERGIATLTFTDAARSRYLNLLQQLRWEWGSRFEQKLARSVATDLLKKHFDYTDPWPELELNAHAYQTQAGAVAILPYADGDLRLSALAADLAAERFDQTALARYFDGLLQKDETTRSQATLALYGLAALDRPVLQQIDALLAASDLTVEERLTLALARARLGDLEGARPIYREIVQAKSEPVGSAARIKEGRDQDEILAHTALAGVLAAKLGEPEAAAYAEYLATNHGTDVLTVMEQALIAQAALPQIAPEAASFTYVLNGKEEQKELKPGQTLRLPVPAGDVAGLKFKAVKGQVGLTVAYEGAAGAADLKKEAGFSLVRSYSVVGKVSGTKMAPGDLVKITLAYQMPKTAPTGTYEISDYLPAGLRLVERPWQYGVRFDKATDPAWPISVDGQRVTFWASQKAEPISYYARVTSAGQFTADSPTLQLQKSGQIYTYGPRDQVQVAW